MRKISLYLPFLFLLTLTVDASAAISIKAGSTCQSIGKSVQSSGKIFTCVKSGKRKIWDKGKPIQPPATPIPTASPSSSPSSAQPAFIEPAKPTSFENLVENADGITYWAWKLAQDRKKNLGKTDVNFVIQIGPNTTMKVKEPLKHLQLVADFFSNRTQVKNAYVTFYDYPDVAWAQEQDSKVSVQPRPREVADSCASSDRCNGGNAYVDRALNGFNYLSSSLKFTDEIVQTNGTVVIHEYFHTLQTLPLEKSGQKGLPIVWMPDWVREGSAQWLSTSLTFDDFKSYMIYRKSDADQDLYKSRYSEQQVSDVLSINTGQSNNGWLAYNVGARAMEALVLIKGIDSMLELYDEGAAGNSFEEAFKKIYGIDWSTAKPILSKAISKSLRS